MMPGGHRPKDGSPPGGGTRSRPANDSTPLGPRAIAQVTELRPALTDITGARRYLGGISRSKFYQDVLQRIEVVRIGSRVLVVVESLDHLIEQLRAEAEAR